MTLLNPTPVLTGISPSATNLQEPSAITLNGNEFVCGAQVLVDGLAIPTTFVSSTQLTASAQAATAGPTRFP